MLVQEFYLENGFLQSGHLHPPVKLSIVELAEWTFKNALWPMTGKDGLDISAYFPFLRMQDCAVFVETIRYSNHAGEPKEKVNNKGRGLIIWQDMSHIDIKKFYRALLLLLDVDKGYHKKISAMIETLQPENIELAIELMGGIIDDEK